MTTDQPGGGVAGGKEMRRANGPEATPAINMITAIISAGRHRLGMRNER